MGIPVTADQEHEISLPRSKCIVTDLPHISTALPLNIILDTQTSFLIAKISHPCISTQHRYPIHGNSFWKSSRISGKKSSELLSVNLITIKSRADHLITDIFLHWYEMYSEMSLFLTKPLSLQEEGACVLPHVCKYLCELNKWQGH